MRFVVECPVVAHQEVAPGHFRLSVRAPDIAGAARPGQFAMLQVAEGYQPFLRRPMSFERIFPDSVSFLYKVEGEGTRLLSRFAPGQVLSVQGPLGNGFRVDHDAKRHVLVAGGIGVAPFPALAESLLRVAQRPPEVILAARNRHLLLCEQDFRRMGCAVHIATDDGSAGAQGLATDVLERVETGPETRLYACGPMPMLAAVAGFALTRCLDCQVSLEAQMACGLGACMSCVVQSTSEKEGERMLRVCEDGPVFDVAQIDWDAAQFGL